MGDDNQTGADIVDYIHNRFRESAFGHEAYRLFAEDLVLWGGPTEETKARIQQLVQRWFEIESCDQCATKDFQ